MNIKCFKNFNFKCYKCFMCNVCRSKDTIVVHRRGGGLAAGFYPTYTLYISHLRCIGRVSVRKRMWIQLPSWKSTDSRVSISWVSGVSSDSGVSIDSKFLIQISRVPVFQILVWKTMGIDSISRFHIQRYQFMNTCSIHVCPCEKGKLIPIQFETRNSNS